eukprot:5798494-Prymnesium_polylepis.1
MSMSIASHGVMWGHVGSRGVTCGHVGSRGGRLSRAPARCRRRRSRTGGRASPTDRPSRAHARALWGARVKRGSSEGQARVKGPSREG